jgi:hypothetical protein
MTNYRIAAATKEEWAERAMEAENRLSLLESEHMLMLLINECPDVTVGEVIHMILERQEYFGQEPHDVE